MQHTKFPQPQSGLSEEFDIKLMRELPYAVDKGELSLNYQAVFDLNNKHLNGIEAFVRWKNSSLGQVSPALYIENPLAFSISEWALEKGCAQMVEWFNQNLIDPSVKLYLNISINELLRDDFLETIDNIIEKTRIEPKSIIFDFSDVNQIDNDVSSTIQALTGKGFGFCFDNYGAGSADWKHLNLFKVIKVDATLVESISDVTQVSPIISAILAVAKEYKISINAEGVETETQLNYFKDKHCNAAQGFYLGKPLSADEFRAFITSYQKM